MDSWAHAVNCQHLGQTCSTHGLLLTLTAAPGPWEPVNHAGSHNPPTYRARPEGRPGSPCGFGRGSGCACRGWAPLFLIAPGGTPRQGLRNRGDGLGTCPAPCRSIQRAASPFTSLGTHRLLAHGSGPLHTERGGQEAKHTSLGLPPGPERTAWQTVRSSCSRDSWPREDHGFSQAVPGGSTARLADHRPRLSSAQSEAPLWVPASLLGELPLVSPSPGGRPGTSLFNCVLPKDQLGGTWRLLTEPTRKRVRKCREGMFPLFTQKEGSSASSIHFLQPPQTPPSFPQNNHTLRTGLYKTMYYSPSQNRVAVLQERNQIKDMKRRRHYLTETNSAECGFCENCHQQ